MRLVIGDDAPMVRDGMARLLSELGHEVVGLADDGHGALELVAATGPDALIVDIRMPPTFTDEGIVVATAVRAEHPEVAVLVLSNHLELRYAMRLAEEAPSGCGYLLKERVASAGALTDALERLRRGECVVDQSIVSRLLSRRRDHDPLERLSGRERDVLELMAEGLSNRGIAERLVLSERTIEAHVANIFMKLDIVDEPDGNRRVIAVLRAIRSGD